MRFFILSLFLLSLFLSTVVNGQYAGVFLNTQSKARAATFKATTSPYADLNAVDKSFNKLEAHHMTIEFKPNPAEKFQDFDGLQFDLKVLAYVHDSHGQALLVSLENNPCKDQGGIEIANAWPHVTISHENSRPYTAVYSNDLIARAINQNFLRVKQIDSYGKPSKVALWPQFKQSSTESWGISGNYTAPPTPTTAEITYAATPIYVKVFPQEGYNVIRLKGTECYNTRWNDTTVSCKLL